MLTVVKPYTSSSLSRSYEENQDNGFTVGDLCTAEEEDLCVAWYAISSSL